MDGYKRSLDLVAQVSLLNFNPLVDYYIYDPNNTAIAVLFVDIGYLQTLFRACREIVMTTGDPYFIATVAHFLCAMLIPKNLHTQGITCNMIVSQLAREFVFDDLRGAVLEMQELQNRDPLRRPYDLITIMLFTFSDPIPHSPLLEHTPPELWTELTQYINFPDIVVTLE